MRATRGTSQALELGIGLASMALALGVGQRAWAALGAGLPRNGDAAAHVARTLASQADRGDGPAAPQLAMRTEPVASYVLKARLDADQHTLEGTGTLIWRNTARVATDELYFHLYLNAFENERTLFLRSPFRTSRSAGRTADYGYIEVRSLRCRELGGVDLWPRAAAHSPGDPEDRTDIHVPLPQASRPGDTLTLDVDFVAKLPRGVERTGYSGSFHMGAQWFPKLARLEPDGRWAHFAYHSLSEFYADFGDYDVTLDVPAGHVVGATGRRVSRTLDGARAVERYRAESVHDFAFAAWDGFREELEAVGAVEVRVLYPAEHALNARRTLEMLRFALPRFSRLYGEYPWSTLTVVHPPATAPQVGGMEYPTLITTGAPWYAPYVSRAVEIVTAHELAHQWFQGLVATDESRWPFLDEGLSTYAESEVLRARFGPGNVTDVFGLTLDASALRRAHAAEHQHRGPIAQAAADYPSFSALGALAYSRTGTLLESLARVHGEEAVTGLIGEYARAHRFGHPGPDDLLTLFQARLGASAAEDLRRALFERGTVNYRAGAIECTRETTSGGSFASGPGAPRELRLREELSPPRHRCRALLEREGTLTLPVEVELIDAAGARRRELWATPESTRAVEHEGEQPLVAVHIDPDQRVTLDSDLLDNARRTRAEPPWRTLALLTYLGQLGLRWLPP